MEEEKAFKTARPECCKECRTTFKTARSRCSFHMEMKCFISEYRLRHKCLLEGSRDPNAESLLQLQGENLAKFLEGIQFASPRQKVMLFILYERCDK